MARFSFALLNPASPTYNLPVSLTDQATGLTSTIDYNTTTSNNLSILAPSGKNIQIGTVGGATWRVDSNGILFASSGQAWTIGTSTLAPQQDNTLPIGDATHRVTTVNTKTVTIGQSLTNPAMGVATLSGGAATAIVYTTAFTSGSRVWLSPQNTQGTVGRVSITSSTAGTNFTIGSSSATDTSTIAWWITPVT